MKIIKQNPYRTLGLLASSSERELQKQIAIIKRFSEIGKHKSFDYDFEFIGDIARQTDDIHLAASQIEQAQNKLLYSLFWFVNNSQFDEIALSNLKDRNIEKAIEVWNKTLRESVTSKNYSSYQNLSALYFALSVHDGGVATQCLEKGIKLKGDLLHSDCLVPFSELTTGNGSIVDPINASKKFVDELIDIVSPYLDKNNGITTKQFIALFASYPNEVQKYLSNRFTAAPISDIENKIEKTAVKRKDSPFDAEEHGEELYIATKKDVVLLRSILGAENAQLQMIINKLANEILQCAIDFYNEYRTEESDFDPGESAIKVVNFAGSMGAAGQTKTRIVETHEVIQEWVDDSSERESLELIQEDIAFVATELQKLENAHASIQRSKLFVIACKPKLENIRNISGSSDEFYLQICDAVVNNALGMLIEVVNSEQENMQGLSAVLAFESTVKAASYVTQLLVGLDMTSETRGRLNTNKRTISQLSSQVKEVSNRATASANSSGACYIATMAYGSYNHPQVVILRKYRDEKLSTTLTGRLLIKLYYATSPHMVRILKNRNNTNNVIRNQLDRYIKWIK